MIVVYCDKCGCPVEKECYIYTVSKINSSAFDLNKKATFNTYSNIIESTKTSYICQSCHETIEKIFKARKDIAEKDLKEIKKLLENF